ncbi:LysR substrate-binding domain-containing protein [Neptuniibacter marinus]|uniref:LysR substrate-binding domain-containing protein n=1 Tax=Neptuniibacter marinus TaxID=1806670 RepID=UPI0008321E57|nr:LysR substrate-binding domain-containing protein [Neptuniibacter marinus]
MTRLPPLKALRVFQFAAESGSFKLAAEKLNVTQAAISQQIKLLEDFFGEPLFLRLNREVRATPSAHRLLPYIQQAFALIEEGSKTLEQDSFSHQLKITSIPSFAAQWLIPKLGAFQTQHPDLSCFVSTSLDLHDFSDDSQDLAIRFGSGGFVGLEERMIANDYILPLCHPMLLEQLNRGERTIDEMPILLDSSQELETLNNAFKAMFGGTSKVALQVKDSSLLMNAALNGQGVAPIRYSLAFELIQRGQLVCPVNFYWHSVFSYYLVAPEAYFQRHKVKVFSQWIINEVSVIESTWQVYKQKAGLQLQRL